MGAGSWLADLIFGNSQEKILENFKQEINYLYLVLGKRMITKKALEQDLKLCDEIGSVFIVKESLKANPKDALDMVSLKARVLLENWENGSLKYKDQVKREGLRLPSLGNLKPEFFKKFESEDIQTIYETRNEGAILASKIKKELEILFKRKYAS